MSADPRAAARQFVRSLNILLKFARLYEFGHVRTAAQFETTWKELRSALDESGESGLLLGASGTQILLDGVPLGAAAAERSFAQLLSTSGIASIHFAANLSQPQFARFVRAFPSGNAKAYVSGGAIESCTGRRNRNQGQRNPLHRGGFVGSRRKDCRKFDGEGTGRAGRQVQRFSG